MRRPTRKETEDAIRKAKGNMTRAAAALGRSRRQVYRLVDMHGLRDVVGIASRSVTVNPDVTVPTEDAGVTLHSDVTPICYSEPRLPDMETLLAGPRVDTTVTVPRELWKAVRKLAIDEEVAANVLVVQALTALVTRRRSRQENDNGGGS